MKAFVDVSKVIGTKQTLKVVKEGKAKKVFLAEDTEEAIKDKIIECCNMHNVPIEKCDSKVSLGQAGGIDRGAAVITILTEES
ncbi:MAG: ribosomal L7Ae/L30e/S12e/Gadd45 family protein [Eubacteriaceae bacterium]